MTREEIREGSKLLANYMGWFYIPSDNKGDFPTAGWYRLLSPLSKQSNIIVNYKKYDRICRRTDDLRFFNEVNWLLEVVDTVEREDLSEYFYQWEYEDEKRSNFEGFSVDIFGGFVDCQVHLALDPPTTIGRETFEWNCLSMALFKVMVDSVKYINKVKGLC